MHLKYCDNGHSFEKTSDCPVCHICSAKEMQEKYGAQFPKIGAPAFRAINSVGISQLSDITKYSEEDLLKLHGFGPKALTMLREALNKENLSFLP